MLYLVALLVIIIAYLLGSVSSSIIISKKISGEDIRNSGSGNAGATNMLRTHGKGAGAVTLLLDALKGAAAILIGLAADKIILMQTGIDFSLFERSVLLGNLCYIAGIFAVLGHMYPIYFAFKGGKGVATSLGVMLMLDWQVGLIVAAAAVIIMAVTRYVSLGSVIGAFLYPVAVLAFTIGKGQFNLVYFICSLILGALVIFKHHENISRLLAGNENRLFSKKKN